MIGIVYGSNGGRARDCALDIYFHYSSPTPVRVISSVTNFDRFDLLVFIVSTGGFGAFPRGFYPIWEELNKMERINKFCIFGLGDSRYERYNYPARLLYDLLSTKGDEFLPLCLGDDQDPLGYQAMFYPWKIELLSKLGVTSMLRSPSIFAITELSERHGMNLKPLYTNCELIAREVAASNEDRHVYTFDLKLDFDFNLGDVLALYHQPNQDLINKVLEVLEISGDTVIDLKINDKNWLGMGYDLVAKGRYHVRTLLTNFLDLNSFVSPWMMSLLSEFATLDIHAEKLREFGSPAGLYLFNKYADYERRSLADVLIDFNSIRMSVEDLINLVPPILPRYYSISNVPGYSLSSVPRSLSFNLMFSRARLITRVKTNVLYNLFKIEDLDGKNHINKLEGKIAQLCVALVENYTISGQKKLGSCSNWLINDLSVGDRFYARVSPCLLSDFTKKRLTENPAIFLSTGTGVSAVRPWLMYKLLNQSPSKSSQDLVIAGFRRPKALLYHSEWFFYSRCFRVDLAYSRIGDSKRYIQHALPDHTDLILSLIMNNCIIYISGRSKDMPEAIISELATALGKLNYTKEQALKFISHLEASERLIFETW